MLHLKKHKLIKFVVFLPIYCIKWFLSFNRTKSHPRKVFYCGKYECMIFTFGDGHCEAIGCLYQLYEESSFSRHFGWLCNLVMKWNMHLKEY